MSKWSVVPLHKHFSQGKVVLFAGSAIASVIIASVVGAAAASVAVGVISLVAVFPGYVYVGAHAIRAAEDLMNWGFPGEKPWTTDERLAYGAAWPLIALFGSSYLGLTGSLRGCINNVCFTVRVRATEAVVTSSDAPPNYTLKLSRPGLRSGAEAPRSA